MSELVTLATLLSGGPTLDLSLLNDSENACCQQIICCSPGSQNRILNKRIVLYKDSQKLAPEKENGFGTKLKDLFCCCRGEKKESKKDQNKIAKIAYNNYLVLNYGTAAARAGPFIANVPNWNRKLQDDSPLTVDQAFRIEQAAAQFKDNDEPFIRNIMKQMRLYLDSKNSKTFHMADGVPLENRKFRSPQSIVDDDDSLTQAKTSKHKRRICNNSPTDSKCHVINHKNVVEEFRPEKMIKDLQRMTPKTTIGDDQITKIVQGVQKTLNSSKRKQVSTDTIRQIVLQELHQEGIVVSKPDCYDELKRKALIEAFRTKYDPEELSTEELEAILELKR